MMLATKKTCELSFGPG